MATAFALVPFALRSLPPLPPPSSPATVDGCDRPIKPVALPPAYIYVDAQARDVRLNWTTIATDFDEPRALINPSLLWSSGNLVRAAK